MANGAPNYLPGFEPDNIKPLLDTLLNDLDASFPDKTVVWSEWNHEKWDRAAGFLCKNLGYSRGTEFLEAYGYSIVQTRDEIPTTKHVAPVREQVQRQQTYSESSPTSRRQSKRAFCPNCGEELENTSVKFCPSCGEKLIGNPNAVQPDEKPRTNRVAEPAVAKTNDKKRKAKREEPEVIYSAPKKKKKRHPILIAVIILLVIGIFRVMSDGNTSSDSSSSTTAKTSETTTEKTSSDTKPTSSKPSPTPITYTQVDITTLFDELDGNALAAKEKYKNMYISVQGRLSNVDASGKYIGIGAGKDNYDYIFKTIQCYIKSDDVKNKVMALQSDDLVTIKGKITNIGEIMGYSLDINEIEIPAGRQVSSVNSNLSTTAGTYTEIGITTLFDDLENNALLAKSTYKGAYVSVSGRLSNIDASGKYISLGADKNDYNHLLNSLHCSIKSDAVKKAVMNMTVDSWITVKGKITDVGEILGYTIDIDEFG